MCLHISESKGSVNFRVGNITNHMTLHETVGRHKASCSGDLLWGRWCVRNGEGEMVTNHPYFPKFTIKKGKMGPGKRAGRMSVAQAWERHERQSSIPSNHFKCQTQHCMSSQGCGVGDGTSQGQLMSQTSWVSEIQVQERWCLRKHGGTGPRKTLSVNPGLHTHTQAHTLFKPMKKDSDRSKWEGGYEKPVSQGAILNLGNKKEKISIYL